MNGPKPQPDDGADAPKPMSDPADERVQALSELHRQMVELNARLEYLNLILKLGVR
jgi:hypothetical protein